MAGRRRRRSTAAAAAPRPAGEESGEARLPVPGPKRRRWGGEKGQALVEVALALPILLLLLFAIVDFGMGFQAWITVTSSAREGARLGISGADATAIESRVRATADTLEQSRLTVTVNNAQGQPGESVAVDVRYQYDLISPLAGLMGLLGGTPLGPTLDFSSTADMRLE